MKKCQWPNGCDKFIAKGYRKYCKVHGEILMKLTPAQADGMDNIHFKRNAKAIEADIAKNGLDGFWERWQKKRDLVRNEAKLRKLEQALTQALKNYPHNQYLLKAQEEVDRLYAINHTRSSSQCDG